MAADRVRYVAVTTAFVQVGLGSLALWALWDTKVASDRFSREYVGEPLHYTAAAILVSVGLVLLYGSATISALLWRQVRQARRLFTLFLGVALSITMVWWLVLALSSLGSFFVSAGTLLPNEIMGASWPLFVVVALLSAAALLGLIPLVCMIVGRVRLTRRCS